jgi:pyruvate-formate lyase-activating enzyme
MVEVVFHQPGCVAPDIAVGVVQAARVIDIPLQQLEQSLLVQIIGVEQLCFKGNKPGLGPDFVVDLLHAFHKTILVGLHLTPP